MAEYHDITREEIEEFLVPQGFAPVSLPGVSELVYAKRVDQDGHALSLRVYTGIDPSGRSRGVGEDAIRCVIFGRDSDKTTKVATSKRVHRVAGWRANLQDRLDHLAVGPACRACGAPTIERKSARGPFRGCSRYPECRETARL